MVTLDSLAKRMQVVASVVLGLSLQLAAKASLAQLEASQPLLPRVLTSGPNDLAVWDFVLWSGTWTGTLPPLATSQSKGLTIASTAAGVLTLAGYSADTIGGSASQDWTAAGAEMRVSLIAGPTDWIIFGTGHD